MRKKRLWIRFLASVMSTALFCTIPTVSAAEYHADMGTEMMEAEQAVRGEQADVEISSVNEWNEFAKKVNNGNSYSGKIIQLTRDIQFDGVTMNNVTLIDKYGTEFNGTFDGNGYTLSQLHITSSLFCNIGLFGGIGKEGVIKNLTIKDSVFYAKPMMEGGVLAFKNEGTIDNCHVRDVEIKTEESSGSYMSGDNFIAGIVAENEGTVVNCSSSATIQCKQLRLMSLKVGGIAAKNTGMICNCCNMGKISTNNGSIAGIASSNDGTVENCYNVGGMTNEEALDTAGIVYENWRGTVYNCYFSEKSSHKDIFNGDGVVQNCMELPPQEMQSPNFADRLNTNRGSNTDWLEWEIRPEEKVPYPVHVKRISLSKCQASLNSKEERYDGTEKKPGVILTYNGTALKNSEDYTVDYENNVDAGYAAAVIQGMGRYMGSTRLVFTIAGAEISACDIFLDTDVFVYDGKGQKPAVKIKQKTKTLREGTDYTLSVINNVNPGKGQITITGKGNYKGKAVKKFTIQRAGQILSGKSSWKKVWGDKPFFLNVQCIQGNGALKYISSNKNVAVVDKNGKIRIKGTGRAVITVTAQETDRYKQKTRKITVNVAPKQQKASVKRLAGQKINVKWKKDTRATGYQIQCSTDSKFKKNVMSFLIKKNKTTAKKIGKLKKGQTYYIRVRSYKAVKGTLKEVYGSWSKKQNCRSI